MTGSASHRTHAQIVTKAVPRSLAALCDVSIHTVHSWRQRGNIPAPYWRVIAEAGLADFDELAMDRKRKSPTREYGK